MAILASLFSISAFRTTRLAFRKLSVRSIVPIRYLPACYTEPRERFGEHPFLFLLYFPLIFFHRGKFFLEYTR